MSNLIFGWNCGLHELEIFLYELRLIFELMLDSSQVVYVHAHMLD